MRFVFLPYYRRISFRILKNLAVAQGREMLWPIRWHHQSSSLTRYIPGKILISYLIWKLYPLPNHLLYWKKGARSKVQRIALKGIKKFVPIYICNTSLLISSTAKAQDVTRCLFTFKVFEGSILWFLNKIFSLLTLFSFCIFAPSSSGL